MEKSASAIQRFEERRSYLRSIAFRMLGSVHEAEDAMQDTWLRIHRGEGEQIENVDGWTVTVLTRICLDMLRRRKGRLEGRAEYEHDLDQIHSGRVSPEDEATMAEAVGAALLVILNTLSPSERLAFVMHDMFGFQFEEIATALGKSSVTVRQLASRARRKVRGAPRLSSKLQQDQQVVTLFLAYLRAGDMAGVMSVLHPDVVRHADVAAVPPPGQSILVGRDHVSQEAATNIARAQFAQTALVNGQVGIVVAPHGRMRVALLCSVSATKITRFDVIANPATLVSLKVSLLPVEGRL